MADEYIVVGSSEGKLAGHASTIDSLVIAYKDGKTEERAYHPDSKTLGQEVMQFIDANFPEAKAVITKEMEGPPNYNKWAVIKEDGGSIEEVVEKYKNGEYDAEIEKYSLEEKAKEAPAKTPKNDGSGGGTRANKGRSGCPPEEQEEYGRGSGTEEGKPKGTAYESKKSYESNNAEEESEESAESSSEESDESGESSGEND
jgi:hypothetical protein